MNKFRRFLGKLSAETYQNGLFSNKSQKSPSAGYSPLDLLAPGGWMFSPHTPFKFNNQKYDKTLLPFYILDPSKY